MYNNKITLSEVVMPFYFFPRLMYKSWASQVVLMVICLPLPETQELLVQPLGLEDPLEEEMATHSRILAGKSHGQRSLAGYSPWGCKELDMTEGT